MTIPQSQVKASIDQMIAQNSPQSITVTRLAGGQYDLQSGSLPVPPNTPNDIITSNSLAGERTAEIIRLDDPATIRLSRVSNTQYKLTPNA